MKTSLGEIPVATFVVTYEPDELIGEPCELLVTIDLRRLRPLALRATTRNNTRKATGENGAIVVERLK